MPHTAVRIIWWVQTLPALAARKASTSNSLAVSSTVVPVRDAAVATPALGPSDEATRALKLLGETRLPELPVTEGERVIGSVTRDDLARALSLDQLDRSRQPGRFRWDPRDVPT